MRHKLILWDIDGTLLYSGGVAGEAMRAAMTRVYGRPSDNERRAYAGKTDQQIILETFPDRPAVELLSQLDVFTATYLDILSEWAEAFRTRGRVLEGVVDVLRRLRAEGVVQSLLTGNLAPVARLKLDLMGLAEFFDFDSGAYGSDSPRRIDLAPIAAARAAQRYRRAFANADIVVIGDTPNDIACARAAGARAVAVATGPFSIEELRTHAPDAVLPSLADTGTAMAAILAG
ncbi:MAG: hydrolase [Roseiflexus castenholzii]|uniref:HAD family hydrolase n=1 Tax=Roseiflexus castenholzii TaxID=120962 RepID=UPI000CB877A8|nr:MAG: hydrolase [Roseiflexus castenholzii]